MENLRTLNQQRTKRFWRGFWIGAAAGVILSLLSFGCIFLSGPVSIHFFAVFYDTISLPARLLYMVFGQEYYHYLLNSFFLVPLTNSILLGLLGAGCGLFLKKKKDAIRGSTD